MSCHRGRCLWIGTALACLLAAAFGEPLLGDGFLPGISWQDAISEPGLINVAHAGASSIAPQNTLAAGRAALEDGAHVWGVDVRRTRDGVFILMHDATLDRTTDAEQVFPARAPWQVSDFTLSEIRQLDAGSWFAEEDPFGQIAQGAVPSETAASFTSEPVPTLREALEFVADNHWLIDIEIKAPFAVEPAVVAAELSSLIEQTQTTRCALVSSFDHGFLRELRRIAPDLPIGALALLPPAGGFEALDAAGIGVLLWTYNRASQWEHAFEVTAAAEIYTDFPQRLDTWLRERTP